MNDFLRLAVILVAAVNPAAFMLGARLGLGDGGLALARAALAGVIAFAALLAAALLADEILEFLEVAPETFRVAAGVVFLAAGAATILRPSDAAPAPRGHLAILYPLAWPLLLTPAAVAAAISLAADDGRGGTIGATALALGVAVAACALPGRTSDGATGPWRAGARLLAAVLVVAGAGLIVSGVRDV